MYFSHYDAMRDSGAPTRICNIEKAIMINWLQVQFQSSPESF